MSRDVETAIRMARAYAAEQLSWFSTPLYAARLIMTEAERAELEDIGADDGDDEQ